jgi:hypothetical protein
MYQISFAKILIIQAVDSQIFMQSIADLIIFVNGLGLKQIPAMIFSDTH